jgi:hypothetical protein
MELQTKYETEKKQQEIEILNAKNAKNQIIIYASVAGIILLLAVAFLAINRYRVKHRANELLEARNLEIHTQKEIIEAKNKGIMDSINYAKRIQDSLLPTEKYIQRSLERLRKK